jgi:methionyl-tRNA formyltransferase
MGTPALAATALRALWTAGYALPLVVTRPDQPKGRGQRPGCSPVKALALELGLEVYQPAGLKENDAVERIRAAAPDVIAVAAYGGILPPALLAVPPLGCLNIHASLLPAYRGAAPIQWVLLEGEAETGVTIMKLDQGLDTGPILASRRLPIPADMDYGGLYEALSALGAALLLETLPRWAAGELTPQEQPAAGSYASRLERRHERIAWRDGAVSIQNRIRAFSPWPGAYTTLEGKEIKILRAEAVQEPGQPTPAAGGAVPGAVVDIWRRRGPVVATGQGRLLLTTLQPAGKRPVDGWAWLNGSRMTIGQRFAAGD